MKYLCYVYLITIIFSQLMCFKQHIPLFLESEVENLRRVAMTSVSFDNGFTLAIFFASFRIDFFLLMYVSKRSCMHESVKLALN